MFTKKHAAWLLTLLLAVSCIALAVCEEPAADRYASLFDVSADAGLLTARFLQLTSTSDEKSGDCAILISPDGKVMLLDAGETTCADQVIAALTALGVTKIDYLVASHPHIDHVGGFVQVMQSFEVDTVYSSAVVYPTNTYQAYIDEIEHQGITHVILSEGDMLSFGDLVTIEVFHPSAEISYYDDYPKGSTQFVNDLSLVLKFTYGEATMLFAGDLYTYGEKEVAERYGDKLRSDVLKVNHHGAETSSSKTWRQAIQPKIAVIMHDGIASLQVIQKYQREETAIYHTFMDGCIKVSATDTAEYEVLTQFDRQTDFLD